MGFGFTTAGLADRPHAAPEPVTRAEVKQPLRYAPFRYGADRKIELLGEFVTVDGSSRGGNCSDGLAYDSFDISTDGLFTIDPLGNQCGLAPTARYSYFASPFYHPYIVDDFQTVEAAAGQRSQEITFAAVKGVLGPTWAAVATYEDVAAPGTCGLDTDGDGLDDAPAGGFLSGFVFDFGVAGGTAGYIQFIVNLCNDPNNAAFDLPQDGGGAYEIAIGADFQDSDGDGTPDTLVLADQVAPALWFNFNNNAGFVWTLTGQQTLIYWPDGGFTQPTNPDGMIDIFSECFNIGLYPTINCPGNDNGAGAQFGSVMAMFYTAGGGDCPNPGCTTDLDGNCIINISDLTVLLSAYGTSAGGDVDDDGDTDINDLTLLLSEYGSDCN
jgi:hypothetical protein